MSSQGDARELSLRRGCTVGEAAAIVRHHLCSLWSHPQHSTTIAPLMLWGPPGVGKSAVIRQICEDEAIGFLDVRLAQREPVDIRGLPVPREDGVHWLTAAEWPREGRGIILFDELTAADRSLQVAAYEFILDRRLGDLYRVPDGWYLCAAGNRGEDRAVALTMSSALANRFCHLEIEADVECWVHWALAQNVNPLVIGFIRFQPQVLYRPEGDLQQGWPTPRGWERVGLELDLARSQGLDERSLRLVVQGIVGPTAATELFAYLAWADRLPEVEAMLRGTTPLALPERADQRYALCTAAVHFAQRFPELVDGLLRLGLELPPDFAAMTIIDYLNARGPQRVEERARELFAHPAFAAWKRRHGASFRERFASMTDD